MSLDNEVAS